MNSNRWRTALVALAGVVLAAILLGVAGADEPPAAPTGAADHATTAPAAEPTGEPGIDPSYEPDPDPSTTPSRPSTGDTMEVLSATCPRDGAAASELGVAPDKPLKLKRPAAWQAAFVVEVGGDERTIEAKRLAPCDATRRETGLPSGSSFIVLEEGPDEHGKAKVVGITEGRRSLTIIAQVRHPIAGAPPSFTLGLIDGAYVLVR